MQCGRHLHHTTVDLIQGLSVIAPSEIYHACIVSKYVAGYGMIGVKAILLLTHLSGLASSKLLVAVNEGIFGFSHVECIGILVLRE